METIRCTYSDLILLVPPLMVYELLDRIAEIMQEYCEVVNEETLKLNLPVIYQVMIYFSHLQHVHSVKFSFLIHNIIESILIWQKPIFFTSSMAASS